jgi:hypothetical protein
MDHQITQSPTRTKLATRANLRLSDVGLVALCIARAVNHSRPESSLATEGLYAFLFCRAMPYLRSTRNRIPLHGAHVATVDSDTPETKKASGGLRSRLASWARGRVAGRRPAVEEITYVVDGPLSRLIAEVARAAHTGWGPTIRFAFILAIVAMAVVAAARAIGW